MNGPLVVNTRDGVCWTRRTVTSGGIALYAPEGVCKCPEFVMATLAELAEHGITGSADVLPVPVGPQPVDAADQREQAVAWEGHVLGAWDGKFAMETGLDRAVLKLARMVKADVSEIERLRAQVAALLAERHETNEALDDAVRELRARQACPCPSEGRPHQVGCPQAEVPPSCGLSADELDEISRDAWFGGGS